MVISNAFRRISHALVRWFDTAAVPAPAGGSPAPTRRVDWVRVVPFIAMHAMCLGVFFVGWHPGAVAVAIGLYLVRMFAITGFYHRYFS